MNRVKAVGSSVPAIGMLAPATRYQEARESRPSELARAMAVLGIVPVKRENVWIKLNQSAWT